MAHVLGLQLVVSAGAKSQNESETSRERLEDARKKHKRIWSNGLNRGFSDDELERFLSVVDNETFRLCFLLQAYMGLRISEAVKVHIDDVNFKKRTLRVYSPKTDQISFLYLHEKIYEILRERIRADKSNIMAHQGFILYPKYKSGSKRKHISKNCVRVHFKRYLKKAGLDDVYAVVPNSEGQPGKERKLYRLSTHSLRHYFITRVYKETLNPIITQKLARHNSFSSTQVYINMSSEDEMNGMKKAFENPKQICDGEGEGELDEFIRFYKVWKERNEGS